MIRRQPLTATQRCRRAVGALTVVGVTILAVRALDSPGGAPAASAERTPGAPRTAGTTRAVRRGGPTRSPPRAAIAHAFRAAGGPVTAVVTEKGAPVCEVDLLGPSGTVLARGWAAAQPVTLRSAAVANAPLSLVLRPTGGTTLSWQADLSGASG